MSEVAEEVLCALCGHGVKLEEAEKMGSFGFLSEYRHADREHCVALSCADMVREDLR